MKNFPTLSQLDNFVTWEALEQALKGVRQDLAPKEPPERVVIEMSIQTEERVSNKYMIYNMTMAFIILY